MAPLQKDPKHFFGIWIGLDWIGFGFGLDWLWIGLRLGLRLGPRAHELVHASDFGVRIWIRIRIRIGPTGPQAHELGLPISELVKYLPVLKKNTEDPFSQAV